jgi:hypothetical protein
MDEYKVQIQYRDLNLQLHVSMEEELTEEYFEEQKLFEEWITEQEEEEK